MKKLKSQILGYEFSKFIQLAKDDDRVSQLLELTDESSEEESLKQKIHQHEVSFLGGDFCFKSIEFVNRRSVESHFLQYIDLIIKDHGDIWGYSIFPEVFKEAFLKSIQNQDFKGSVIFLGHSPLVLPVIDVLSRFGFNDFVFLDLKKDELDRMTYIESSKGLLGVKFSSVDSTAFIRSQKEYSFCFVTEKDYSTQTLEDMSYFHFLSPHSIVFDLVGESNFMFEDVKALGVGVTDFEAIKEIWVDKVVDKLSNLPTK